MAESLEQLFKAGERLLAIAQQLGRLPAPDQAFHVFRAITFDPVLKLAEMLVWLDNAPASFGAQEESKEYARESPAPFPFDKALAIPGTREEPKESTRKLPAPFDAAPPQLVLNPAAAGIAENGDGAADPTAAISLQRAQAVAMPSSPELLLATLPALTGVFRALAALHILPVRESRKTAAAETAFFKKRRGNAFQPQNLPQAARPRGFQMEIPRTGPSPGEHARRQRENESTIAAGLEVSGAVSPAARPPGFAGFEMETSDRVSSPGVFAERARRQRENANTIAPGLEVSGTVSPPASSRPVLENSSEEFERSPAMPSNGNNSFRGIRMVQGAAKIAEVLRANIATETIPETSRALLAGIESPAPAAIKSEENSIGAPNEKIQPRRHEMHSGEALLPSRLDFERLIEKLEEQLELDLIRTYGTSGR